MARMRENRSDSNLDLETMLKLKAVDTNILFWKGIPYSQKYLIPLTKRKFEKYKIFIFVFDYFEN